MEFVHLQVRSGYSLMNSTNTIEKLVKRAKELGFTSLALTDEGVMYGAVSFYQTCVKNGIKPIIGLSIKVATSSSEEELVLLSKNRKGYENLLKLSSYVQMSDQQVLEEREIAQYTMGCIGILPIYHSSFHPLVLQNDQSSIQGLLETWQDRFEDNSFYLGLEDHGQEEERHLQVALEEVFPSSVPMVAINDVRYLREEDALAYDCLQSIRSNQKWSGEIEDYGVTKHHLRSSQEMYELFSDWRPALLQNTLDIAEQCNLELSFDSMMLPKYPVPSELSSDQYLRQLCQKGLHKRYAEVSDAHKKRLEHELQVIESMKFSDYFLIVWDFMSFARKNGIMTGPGRGSAAGSLVSYLLGITDVDPIEYDLLFERFLNPERISMPDIDIDFSDVKRDEVIQYVTQKYGADHVAQIITFGTFGPRSVLRELIKAMGVDAQEASYLMKFIPQQASSSIVKIVQESKDLQVYIQQSDRLKQLFKIATKLEGLPRHASTHAAGVVISQQSLMQHVPLTAGHDGVPLTQFAMNELESIGLLKMDFLGLRNLTLIEKITKAIEQNEGKSIQVKRLPLNDENTFALLRKGKTNGVFQLESKGMKDVLENLGPNHFEDIVAVNALYRPGPMEFIPAYIRRKHGKEQVTYPHPDLKPILDKTYGVLVYQEQIMQMAHQMAGFSLGQADLLRRAVSKKQHELMMEQKKSFIQGCIQNGYTEEIADELFDWIVRFSNYGFNRSHAVAYSMISYQLAFLKAQYPAYFMAELMSSVSNDKIQSYIKEAKDLGMNVLPPSINKSFSKFTVEDGRIRMGLSMIKGVGRNALAEILEARKTKPFQNLFDFCRRVSLKVVNKQVIESLILAGSFDETFSNRASLMASIHHAMEQGDLFSEIDEQGSMFGSVDLDPTYVEMEPYNQLKQLALESEVLGMYVSSHPLSTYRTKLRANGFLSLQQASESSKQKGLKAAVVVQEMKVIRTKRGDPMAFLTLGDEQEEMEAVVFPNVFRDLRKWLSEEMLVFIQGRIEERNGSKQWIVEAMNPFQEERLQEEEQKRLFLKITGEDEKSVYQDIKQFASKYPGPTPIIIHNADKKETVQLSREYWVDPSYALLKQLYGLLGEKNVVLK
ncbi:DNA polymerase III subunit alpha [Pontibacillus sp. HMF3514]|uniref:DNA polymerase III subunit alpha n=1 Tax=Pontibacillus sp. HMF3514 TaxID=2692425 RepID=UPI00131F6101|nr:DNA polymerase III subunit alpha [Pontibacillus sp. HMF3514]QHE53238.1 DNA polymerase III subunit alpha [Pontibacillus sp. HMF3514]